VERAFVHVDYEQRHLPEHKVERALLLHRAERDAMRRSSSAATALP
jgi:hypothetical protein